MTRDKINQILTEQLNAKLDELDSLTEAKNDRVYYDDNAAGWAIDRSITSYARSRGYDQLRGIMRPKGASITTEMHLFTLNAYDREIPGVSDYHERDGMEVFRYVTSNTIAGKQMPLVAFSFKRNLIYNLTDESGDRAMFLGRGHPVEYARFLK